MCGILSKRRLASQRATRTQPCEAGSGGTVVRVANASTGTSETPTPTGSYRVFRRVEGIDTSPLGKLWNPLYFFRGYAIHGSTTVPPEPASHGCVRVALWEAKRLFERIPHNHVVHVY